MLFSLSFRAGMVLALLLMTGLALSQEPTDEAATPSPQMADLVVVLKSDRILYLYADGLVIGQYPIALGKDPLGTKRQRGDNKTPVGAYILDWRNPDSIFHRSIHISYPDARDIAASAKRGVNPGSNIMIHGQPDYNFRKRSGDWTNGCIAVSNAAIDDIWNRVADGTPIHIYP